MRRRLRCARRGRVQEPLPLQPAEDEFLPFMYAAAQGVSYEGLEPADRLGPPVVRAGRAALGLAALHAGFSDDPRPDER